MEGASFATFLSDLGGEWKQHCICQDSFPGAGGSGWLEVLKEELYRVSSLLAIQSDDLWSRLLLLESTFYDTHGARFKDYWLPFSARLASHRHLILNSFETTRNLFVLHGRPLSEFAELMEKQSFYKSNRLEEMVAKAEVLALRSLPQDRLFGGSTSKCGACSEVLCNAVSLSCGHRFCWGCISGHLMRSEGCQSCGGVDTLRGSLPDWAFSDVLNEHFLGMKGKRPKVLLIGLDGCRPDCLQIAKAPNIMRPNMGFSLKAQTNEITLSGPAWCSVLTGVWENKHTVLNNDEPLQPSKDFGHLFGLLKSVDRSITSAAFCTWSPIAQYSQPFADSCGTDLDDDKTVAMAVDHLSKEQCADVTFVHIDTIDHVGHDYGFHPSVPQYIQAIEKCDGYVGTLLEAVNKRSNQYSEDWMIVMVTDHGGFILPEKQGALLGNHGPNTPECRTIFLTISGSGVVEGEMTPPPAIADVTPTILTFMLGKLPDKRWGLDGVPRALKSLGSSPLHLVEALKARVPVRDYVPQPQRILQFTDVHFYNDGCDEDKQGIELIDSLVGRIKPSLVILTGDIIDGRYCNKYDCMFDIVAPIIKHGIPWTYVPGNHDDETVEFNREDMLKILSYPGCLSRGATSWTHSVLFGPVQLYLMDSNAYISLTPKTIYDFIHTEQIAWYSAYPTEGEVGLAFFHIPLPEYKESKILIGQKGENIESPIDNSGFFAAARKKGDIAAMFVGHDHWNNFVSELDNIWLAYGRISGFTPPSFYALPENRPKCPARGARLIQYDSTKRELSTWEETLEGTVKDSSISKVVPKR